MSDRDAALADGAHAEAATAFADRARARFDDEIVELYVFGSTVHGDTRGLASDVDVLDVLEDEDEPSSVADALRDIAYDVMLEYGPVVELHVLTETEFQDSRGGEPLRGDSRSRGAVVRPRMERGLPDLPRSRTDFVKLDERCPTPGVRTKQTSPTQSS